MIYTLYYKMHNLLNGNTQIESVTGEDLEKLRVMKKMMINHTFGYITIEQAFILDQNMLYVCDKD